MLNDMWGRIAAATKKTGARITGVWRANTPEILATGGASAITTGAALMYSPAGWITGGVLAVVGAVCVAKSRGVG
ncbi:hypothetical protein [Amycolatopsis sp. NPDC059021]|uniref:hypothetical protein n=1 Tax=Amycolatopsis sp. NPDC059021 TaxID=3346704 RepID=UPI00366AAD74